MKRSITEIYFTNSDEKLAFDAIQCDTQKIQAKNIVFGHGSIASAKFENAAASSSTSNEEDSVKIRCGNLSRGIFITDTPIGDESLNSGGGGVIFLKMPSTNGDGDGAYVIQLSHWSGCCPKGFCKSNFLRFTVNPFVTILLLYNNRSSPHHVSGNRCIGKGRFSSIR